MDLAREVAAALETGGDRHAIEFRGTWFTWAQLRAIAARILALLDHAGVPPDFPVALVCRNRIPHAAAILGFVAANRTVSMIYSMQSAAAIARDVRDLRCVAVVADREDWTPEVLQALVDTGSVGIAVSTDDPTHVEFVAGSERLRGGPHRSSSGPAGLELLTSGTTGKPKRIRMPMSGLTRGIVTATLGERRADEAPPFLICWPISNIPVVILIAQACMRQRVILMEKFNLVGLLGAIKAHRLETIAAVYPLIRQLIDADVPKSDLASLRYIFGGSGPLDPETQDQFEEKYGVQILWGYGATEFAGTAATWTPELRRQYGKSKRGSVGRAVPGVNIRIVDPSTGEARPNGSEGVLEAQVEVLGPSWIRTNDIALVDPEGFVFIRGRADGAINRGGFKIIPERVVEVIRRHPAVADAAVVGVKDPGLGEVPAALVEIWREHPLPPVDELESLVRSNLPSHHVPKRFRFVREMPRTASMEKIRLEEVRRLLEE